MTVEIRPFGTRCNIACHYCYQEPQRTGGRLVKSFDIEKIKSAVLAEGGPFSVFGGEPLMVRIADLEAIWAWGYETFGSNSIQTNGTLIRDAHLELFRKYKVHVGVSMDGPGELNDVRWAGSEAVTRRLTAKSEAALAKMLAQGVACSLIITLHRGNAVGERLDRLVDWVRDLDNQGLSSARLHLLESESAEIRERFGLNTAENISVLTRFQALEPELRNIKLDAFSDIRLMLSAQEKYATCVWKGCDPYTTRAVRGVEGNGQRSNCGRTNKDGVEFVKSDAEGFERSLALYDTPYEDGGCEGCRFFLMCRGHCPGTAIEGDWRNRTEHCEVWLTLFQRIEAEMVAEGRQPLSLSVNRERLETEMLAAWRRGESPSMGELITAWLSDEDRFDWRDTLADIGGRLADSLARLEAA